MAQEPDATPLKVVLAAGGTGGHVYPALSVAAELRRLRPGVRFLFIGGDRMEAQIVPAAGIRFRAISVHGLAGRGLSGLTRRVRSAAELLVGIPLVQSLGIMREFSPDVVIGTGGYVSGPVILAARLLGVPSITLEGNRTPGLTSKLVAKMVDVMAVAWPEQEEVFVARVRPQARVVVTGLPVRPGLGDMTREAGARALDLDPSRVTLLALGGSLGSRRINDALIGALRLMDGKPGMKALQVLHVTGKQNPITLSDEEAKVIVPGYRAIPYLDEGYVPAFAVADLVVARAGASTVAEVTARGLASILIPWAGATTGEQILNAEPIAKAGGAIIIPDQDLSSERLAEALNRLLWDRERREMMGRASRLLGKPHAAGAVAALALELACGS